MRNEVLKSKGKAPRGKERRRKGIDKQWIGTVVQRNGGAENGSGMETHRNAGRYIAKVKRCFESLRKRIEPPRSAKEKKRTDTICNGRVESEKAGCSRGIVQSCNVKERN